MQIANAEQPFRIGPDEVARLLISWEYESKAAAQKKNKAEMNWKEMGKGGKRAFHHCVLMDEAFS